MHVMQCVSQSQRGPPCNTKTLSAAALCLCVCVCVGGGGGCSARCAPPVWRLEGRKREELEERGSLKPRGKRGLLGKRPELFLWIHFQKPSETRSTDLFVRLLGPHREVGVTLWLPKLFE